MSHLKTTPLGIGLMVLHIALFLLGRLCDDLSWYEWSISTTAFEAISVGALAGSAIVLVIMKIKLHKVVSILFYWSQIKFLIPWSLIILICILFFNIFGCQHEIPHEFEHAELFYVEYAGCCLNVTQYLLTTLNYSLLCNTYGELPILVVYEIVLFAEIIYNGTLLLKFIADLTEKPKDYSILFVSILIAYQILVMDLLFRAAYEEKEKDQRHQELHDMIIESRKEMEKDSKGKYKTLNPRLETSEPPQSAERINTPSNHH